VVEILEIRTVLAFTHSFADGELKLVGAAGVDHLSRIYAIVPAGFVNYDQVNEFGATVTTTTAILADSVTKVTVEGRSGDDIIDLSESFENIPPLDAVCVKGEEGEDTLSAPPEEEMSIITGITLDGGPNNDSLLGNSGWDTLKGGPGEDEIFGREGLDEIDGGVDDDPLLSGGPGDDTIKGDAGNDTINGDGGDDWLYGGSGDDEILGGIDDDRLFGGPNNDTFNGGPGNDVTSSNTDLFDQDQPYNNVPFMPGMIDMRGSGGPDCDIEDGHIECPFAVEDSYGVTINIESEIFVAAPGVLINDSYDADAVELVPDTGPSHGSFTLYSDGSFYYAPTPGFLGDDTFQYRAINTETGGRSPPTTVTISTIIVPLILNRPPLAPGNAESCGCGSRQEPQEGAIRLDAATLDAVGDAAIERWRAAGADDAALEARLANLQFFVADIGGSALGGVTDDGRIVIDVDAAGHGWFIDATPQTDEEFGRQVRRAQREATSGAAVERADLLSVVMHEIGHALGLDHDHGNATNVMNDTIGLGMRRSPTAWDAAVVDWLFWTTKRRG
jgi:Ca2+-binding RTX toxin-like protein